MMNLGANLGLHAYTAANDGTCDTTKCTAMSEKPQLSGESVSLDVKAGDTVFFIVDGMAGNGGSFSYELECP